ncbi:MAG: D-alanyl-D-alanine carboxypeptidase/D-alanyl-D-alanine-endopeptidase [Sedimentisphaerales bacterium]|nr:D-alanyl-D-alanine carboxypeptidase/D-alanyl-D-alanine-endopeptidase [Sedimentisphaerales bacterium]
MKVQLRKLFVFVVFIFLSARFVQASLASRVNAILSQSSQQKVEYSVCILKADTGVTAYEHDAHHSLIPASNMKVVTTAAALRYLGSDFEYKTKVGIQDSNLVIIGSGDPLLGDRQTDDKYSRRQNWILEGIAKELKDKNINSLKDIIVDTGIFDNELVHPSWPKEELNRSYACEVSGLNYSDNCIMMSLENLNGQVYISIEPQTSFVTLVNEVRAVLSGDSAVAAYRNVQPNKLTIKGECRNKVGPFEVTIERPAAFFGFLLAEYLDKNGIKVTGQFIEKASVNQKDLKQIAEYVTPISDCLDRCNKDSLNFAAEALMKTIAAYNNPDEKNGSWQRGAELIGDFIKELGIDENEFCIDDGCGLSRKNELSANIITKVLLDVYKGSNWSLYRDSLAIGGVEGTRPIADHFQEEKYKGKMLGKSGSLTGVKALSGICITEGGEYIFSIITNNANGESREAINNIVKAIIDEAEGNS